MTRFIAVLLVLPALSGIADAQTTKARPDIEGRPPKLTVDSIPRDTPQEVAAQLRLLFDRDERVQGRAVASLGLMGERAAAAVPFLVDRLYGIVEHMTSRQIDGPPGGATARALVCIGPAGFDPLLDAMRCPNRDIRRSAVAALAAVEDPRAQAAVLAALRDEDDVVRRTTAEFWAAQGERAVAPLLDLLRGGEASLRLGAAEALGYAGDPRVAPALASTVSQDPEAAVRARAARAMYGLPGRAVSECLLAALEDRSPQVRIAAIHSLCWRGEPRAAAAVARLRADPDAGVREAVDRFASADEGAEPDRDNRSVPQLVADLQSPDAGTREEAARRLGEAADPAAEGPLLNALGVDREPGVRAAAAEAIGKLGDLLALPGLIPAMSDPDVSVAISAGRAVGRIGDDAAAETMVRLVEGGNGTERLAATHALAGLRSPGCLRGLLLAAEDPDGRVREVAVQGLSGLPAAQAEAALLSATEDEAPQVRAAALEGLWARRSPHALDAAIAALRPDRGDQMEGASLLATATEPRAVDALIDCLGDDRPYVASAVFAALAHHGDAAAIAPLRERLRGPEAHGRACAARALGQLHASEALDDLIRALTDGDRWVAFQAPTALARLGDRRAVGPLIDALRSTDETVAMQVIRALGLLGDTRAVAPLLEIVGDRPPPAIYMSGEHAYLRAWATDALGKLGDARAVPALLPLLYSRSPRQRTFTALALGQIGDPRATEPLRTVLQDVEFLPRCAARIALHESLSPQEVTALRRWSRGGHSEHEYDGLGWWLTARLRAETGDTTVVGELLTDYLEDDEPDTLPDLYYDLMRLATGEQIGDDRWAWREWWQGHKPAVEG